MKKYNAIQLTKNKMDMNNKKIKKNPPCSARCHSKNVHNLTYGRCYYSIILMGRWPMHGYSINHRSLCIVMQSKKKHVFFNKKQFKKKKHRPKK